MWVNEKAVLNKKPDFEKLAKYGFDNRGEYSIFSADISEGMFQYNIRVYHSGETKLEVIDKATDEEYSLVANESAVGSFVAGVRAECEDILEAIVAKCYDDDYFKSDYARLVVKYMRERYLSEPEHLWEKTPNNVIFRDSKSKRWYLAFLKLEKRKLGIDEDGEVEIINLKEAPEIVEKLVDRKKYFPAFHMNKKHWYTICLDGSVPIEEIYRRIDKSCELIRR